VDCQWGETDRRRTQRFPIRREVVIRSRGRRTEAKPATGFTINISSTGVLFSTDQELTPGRRVELSINWPAQLDDHCPLKLVANGRVVRTEPGRAAIEIYQYEFRTAGSRTFATIGGGRR